MSERPLPALILVNTNNNVNSSHIFCVCLSSSSPVLKKDFLFMKNNPHSRFTVCKGRGDSDGGAQAT